MTSNPTAPGDVQRPWYQHPLVRPLILIGLLYVFLVAVNGLGAGF